MHLFTNGVRNNKTEQTRVLKPSELQKASLNVLLRAKFEEELVLIAALG